MDERILFSLDKLRGNISINFINFIHDIFCLHNHQHTKQIILMETKPITPDTRSFIADGRRFTFQPLTIGRYKEFKKLERHFGWGITHEQDVKDMKKVLQYLNKTDWVNAAVLIDNRLNRITHFDNSEHDVALLICTLFLNEQDEDITVWDETLANDKIEAWNKEGFEATSFFYLAASIVPGFIANLNETSLTILQELQTIMR